MKIKQKMFSFTELPKNLDATDGLAAAVCHFYQRIPSGTPKSCKSWADFVNRNPDKVVKR